MSDPTTDPMTDQSAMPPPVLTSGRLVSLLPRAGGRAWAAEVAEWDVSEPGHVVARVRADAEAVDALDHHKVWLSTVTRSDDEEGVTIFAGTAEAAQDGVLVLDGVVRLAMPGSAWTYGDKATVIVELPSGDVLEVHTVLVRTSADEVVLELVDLGDAEAAALDRYALSRLPAAGVA